MPGIESLRFDIQKAEAEEELLFDRDGFRGFTNTHILDAVHDDSKRVFVARKGSGKTAHRLALLRAGLIVKDIADEIILTDFDPKLFFLQLSSIECKLQISPAILIRNLWRFTIVVRLMQLVRTNGRLHAQYTTEDQKNSLSVIFDYLNHITTKYKYSAPLSILSCVELFSSHVDEFLTGNLRASAVEGFPTNDRFKRAETALSFLLSTGNGALVLIDDLDQWIEASTYPEMLPFVEGLIYAITQLSDNYLRQAKLRMKVFIPEDLFRKVTFRHMDRDTPGHERFAWDSISLKRLLARRIAVCFSMKKELGTDQAIDTILGTVFEGWPNKFVVKDYYKISRDPLTYILFHTHYRPRDLLFLMKCIRSVALANGSDTQKFRPDDVIQGVKLASREYAERVFQEYGQRMPYIKKLIEGFVGKRSSMEYSQFLALIDGRLSELGMTIEGGSPGISDDLYEIGFVGKFVHPHECQPQYPAIAGEENREYLQFSFANSSAHFGNDDLVAIHPVFWGFLEMKQTREFVRGHIPPQRFG